MKIYKGIIIVITIIMILSCMQPLVFAGNGESHNVKTFDQMKTAINSFMEKGKGGSGGMNSNTIGSIIVPIANILTVIGIIVLVGAAMIMGIKYMFASPEAAAKLKQQLIGLLVAGVVVLGATAIWKLVYSILSSSGL